MRMPLDVSILEFGYMFEDGGLTRAVANSVALARIADECGYARFWFTEHHDEKQQIASPEIMIAAIAASTSRIRVGSAGILLNYYSPHKVAENFITLSSLFAGRIDLGLARGQGASPETVERLMDGRPKLEDGAAHGAMFEQKVKTLIGYLDTERETPQDKPQVWLLGAANRSATLAAELGTRLGFTLFYGNTGVEPASVLKTYRDTFRKTAHGPEAATCIALGGICTETDAESEIIMAELKEKYGDSLVANFWGTPERCREMIVETASQMGSSEVVIMSRCITFEQTARMYRLLADVLIADKGTTWQPQEFKLAS